MRIRYIGKFPPPYGGVTVKNELLYEAISRYRVVDRRNGSSSFSQILTCLDAIVRRQQLIIGISAQGGKSKFITALLYIFNRNTMKKSLYFMMGGTEALSIAADKRRAKKMGAYRRIYVETNAMKKSLQEKGLTNIQVFPNCRKRPPKHFAASENLDRPLRCVFFSLISPKKGTNIILAAAKTFREGRIDLYGPIDPKYKAEFEREVSECANVSYKGIFEASGEDVYDLLHAYDVLLFPTKEKTEGVPGALVEAKIAAVPAIVSNICYNNEIVEDGISGIVLPRNTVDCLIEALSRLDADRDALMRMKEAALVSSEKYYIDNYIDGIVSRMES